MGKFIGRDALLDNMRQVSKKNKNEFKGLKGEIDVGDGLAKYLPDDTYIIAKPMIGKYEPDFLIISPTYGFRLIEVKNWSLNSIINVASNGNFTFKERASENPLQQVRKHVEELKEYLSSNYSYLGNVHTLISYVNIQYGFDRKDIEKLTKNWTENSYNNFFKFHLFKNELNSKLDDRLKSATKFEIRGLSNEKIEDIVENVRISNRPITESEINRLQDADERSNNFEEYEQMVEEQKRSNDQDKSNKVLSSSGDKEKKHIKNYTSSIVVLTIIMVLALVVGITYVYKDNEEVNDNTQATYFSKDYVLINDEIQQELSKGNNTVLSKDYIFINDEIQQALSKSNSRVKVDAIVKSFYYDVSSSTKFLELDVDGFIFDAIIFKDTKTPYINVGEKYTFYGQTQQYNNIPELRIETVK